MTRLALVLLTGLLLGGCATLGAFTGAGDERIELWERANTAFARYDFAGAEALFEQLAADYPETPEGRESLFYLGAIRLDPRNAEWDPAPAEQRLAEYLAFQREGGPRLYRYLEAQTLHEIARQLNLPPESRVEGLKPEERVVTVERRVVVPAERTRELSAEVDRLRGIVADREERLRAQEEELERIRRTLTPRQ